MNKVNNIESPKIILILTVILFAGAFLRLYKCNFQSLEIAELQTMTLADPEKPILTVLEFSPYGGSKALYTLAYATFNVFGHFQIVGRLMSCVIGILAVPVIFFLAREFGDSKTALFATAFVSLNYFHISNSQDVTFYGLAFLFSSLSYLFFIRSYRQPTEINFVQYILSTIVLIYTHSFSFLIFCTQVLTFLIATKFYEHKRNFIAGFMFSAITIMIFAPLEQIFIELTSGYSWVGPPKIQFLLDFIYNYLGKDFVSALIFIFLLKFFFTKAFLNSTSAGLKPLYIALLLWVLVPYTLAFAKSFYNDPILHEKFTIVVLPAWAIIVAVGWSGLNQVKWKYVTAVIIAVSAIVNLFAVRKHYVRVRKQQTLEVAQLVKSKNTKGYPVCSNYHREFNFYFGDSKTPVTDTRDMKKITSADTLWLLQVSSEEKRAKEIEALGDQFVPVQQYPFHEAAAVLMASKNRSPSP